MSETNTYIKLFRKLLTWEWYGDTNTVRVFLHILLRANYEPSRYKGHEIPAGSCVFGRQKWAKELGLSERQIRTAINHLKSTNEVTIKATNKFSVIHVEKWEFWQIEEGKATKKKTNKVPTSDQQPTTSKEYKNTNNTTTPTIEDVRTYVKDNNLCIDPDYFYTYYETAEWKDAKGKPVKNWKLKCLTWHRKEADGHTRSDGKRNGTRKDTGRDTEQTSGTGATVHKKFKTMEDVLREDDRFKDHA